MSAAAPRKIYALVDPRDGEIRYIGITKHALERRLREHVAQVARQQRTAKDRWIGKLVVLGVMPDIVQLEAAPDHASGEEAERRWIAHYRGAGVELLNLTDGGAGFAGLARTEEHKRKIGAKSRGRQYTEAQRLKMSESAKARVASPEARAQRAEQSRQAWSCPLKRAALSSAQRRRMADPASRSAVSEGLKRYYAENPHPGIGRKMPEEQRLVLSEKAKQRLGIRTNHPRAKAVMVDGIRFDTGRDAADHFGVSPSAIVAWVKRGKAQYAE